MHPLLEQLINSGPVLTDGAWGTELQARGLAPGDCPDIWNLTHPDRVLEVARSYVNAGSDIILTNTFGANRLRLDPAQAGQVADINRRGVEISREAAQRRVKVFASIGPSGKMLVNDEVTEKELRQTFLEQALALAAADADAIVVETMADLVEAGLAVQAAREAGLPVVACMVFDSGAKKDRTMMGATPEDAARALQAAGADVIGANCGQGIADFIPICQRLRAATTLPIWIKPNAGLPEWKDGVTTYAATPEAFAQRVPALLKAGANFIGGCCGTRPDFIQAIRKVIHPS